jgi:hypothetical protein
MQFHFYCFRPSVSTPLEKPYNRAESGLLLTKRGSKDKKEWLTFRPRLGMCILQYDSE